MATRNTAGRRLLSEAELEFANPFDEAVYSNILETFNAPPAVAPQVVQPTTTAAVPSIDEILIQGGGNPVVINDVLYQPVFASTGQGETFEQGPLTQVVAYNPSETDPGQAYKTYTPNMQEAGTGQFQEVGNIGDILQTAAEDLAPLAAMALTAGGAGGALGGFLTGGGLTGTAASALGNALISGGAGALTGQDPLKAALLAAGGTYAGGLFGGSTPTSDAQFVAADAAQLASQGLGAEQIQQILQSSGVNVGTAISAADVAASGMPADQIADYIAGNKGLFSEAVSQAPATPTTVTTSPEGLQTVTVPAAAPVASINDIVAAIPAAVLPQAATPIVDIPPLEPVGLMVPEAPQAVEVTGTAAAPVAPTLQDIIVALTSSLPPEAPVAPVEAPVTPVPEQITVTAPKAPEVTLSDALAALSGAVTAPPNEVIEVTGTQNKGVTSEDTGATISTIPGVLEPGVGPQSGGGLETADQAARTEKQDTVLTLKDIYTALQALGALSSSGLFGGGGGGGQQRAFVPPTATVPTGNEDYYNAVQQYYNTYMPTAPRDVSTPLQQWYQGKFGG